MMVDLGGLGLAGGELSSDGALPGQDEENGRLGLPLFIAKRRRCCRRISAPCIHAMAPDRGKEDALPPAFLLGDRSRLSTILWHNRMSHIMGRWMIIC